MRGSAAAKSIWAIGIALLVIVLVAAGLPLVASTQLVRDGIARQLSAWSGSRVTLGAAPQVHVWPSFSADLSDVTFSPWDGAATPAVNAEQVHVDLSALAALTGDAVFTRIRFVRPTIRIGEASWALPRLSSGGKLETAVAEARALVKANPAEPDVGSLPRGALAALEIQDGRVVRVEGGKEAEVLTGLSATLDWPALARSATLSASAIWHGEEVDIEASSSEPLLLLAGGAVRTTLTLKSAPVSLAFDGLASLSANAFVDGNLTLSTPSLKRMMEWAGAETLPGGAIGAFEVACHVSGGPARLKFEKSQLKIDGNPGMGVFDVSFGQRPVGISGTLAFKSLDLQSVVSTLAQLPPGPENPDAALQAKGASPFDIDLRLSADSAAVGTVALTDVAATAQVKKGLAALDISDAKAFDGNIQFGLRVDGGAVELRIVADNIDGAAASDKLGWRFLPHARGSASIIIKGHGTRWDEVFATADGSITASFGKGEIPGIDLRKLLEKSAKGGFVPLSGRSEASLPIDAADLKATVVNGIARIDRASATSGRMRVNIGGLVPLAGRGLALSGSLGPADNSAAAANKGVPTLSFFIGGSWNSPFLSPVLPGLPPG